MSSPASGAVVSSPPGAASVQQRRMIVALVGNPNTGKTTLFNALTGYRRHVANYPGVTVDVGSGSLRGASNPTEILDLPGTYSLVSRSADERIARDVLLGLVDGVEPIDAVLVVIDAGNLQRNLYLATQIIDLGFPVVLCCNMIDAAEATGQSIDLAGLSRRLGVPVVGTIANRGSGIADLKHAVTELTLANGRSCDLSLPQTLTHEIDRLA